ncbi:MAG: aminotransferase class V-fold PLP-dependent enzyme [Deltaproteobacteria bacterium]|nr:aminotransferase class V-fold PLP-dependent enzyme [Deltaproteobacteria bacterium]
MKKLSDYRKLFPICEEGIYLNHAGVAPTSLPVCEAVQAWMLELARRGIHMGATWEEDAAKVRDSAARLVGAEAHEITFVRNTSHGLGLVAEGIDWQQGDEVICCPEVEYQSNVYVWQHLSHYGVRVVEVAPEGGGVTLAAVEKARTDKTKLLAVSAVQFATGHKTELKALGQFCKAHDILFCVDGIQWLGSAPLDVKEFGIDFLAADSHKWMLGVCGIGLLFVDETKLSRLRPVLVGWKSTTAPFDFDTVRFDIREDASKFEEGSSAYPLIAGFGACLDLLHEVGLDVIETRLGQLQERLEKGCVDLGAEVSPPAGSRGGSIFVKWPGEITGSIYEALEQSGVRASLRRGRIRFSPHFYTLDEEIDEVLRRMSELVKQFS